MALNRVCLDTSAYSHFRRAHSPVVEALRSAREVYVPVIVLGELRAGFRQGKRASENERLLQTFLAHPVVRVADIDDEAASHFADMMVELRSQGTPVPTNDVWIAAVAVRQGAQVLTYDAHFREIRRVGCEILSS